jgi:predicted acetyltransferase
MKTSRDIRRVCTHKESDFSEAVRGYKIRNQEIRQGLKVSALQQKLEKFRMQWLGHVLCMVDNNIRSTEYVEYTTRWGYQGK